MFTFNDDDDDDVANEAPLDPRLLRIQQRLRRLLVIGLTTLGIGILAVLIAIIYRFFIADTSREALETARDAMNVAGFSAEELGLDAEAELIEQTLDGDRMALTFRDGADLVTIIVDTTTMEVTGQMRVSGE